MKKITNPQETIVDFRGTTKYLKDKLEKLKPFEIGKEQFLKQEKLLFALQEVSKVLTAEVSLQKILADMATIVAKSLGAKWVNFWDLTPDRKAVYIVAHYGMRPEYMEHSRRYPIRLGTAWIGRAVKTGKAWGTSDILKDPKLLKELGPKWKEAVEKQDYRGLLCVPLTSGKTIVGGMCAYFVKSHEFTDFEMRIMTVAANQAATAMANARLFGELSSERNKTFAIIQSLHDGLIMYDLKGRIIFFNPKAEELLWLRGKDVLGKRIDEKFRGKNIYYKNLYNIGNIAQREYTAKEYTTEGPQKLVLEVVYIPVRAQYQKIGTMKILRNITREKEVEMLKSSFVSTASHQLRTPLSGIKWALDTLVKEKLGHLSQEQKDLLEKTYDANERLIRLVADLLDVSRIEEGRFGYNFIFGDLAKLVKKIFNELKIDAERRNINFKFKEPATPLPEVSLDPNKLDIAIRNVIDNAIKYTKSGGSVTVELRKEKHSLFLIIKDNGIGIPKGDQKFIFIKFFRAKNAIRLQPEGSGLGLYIAKNIAEKHNVLPTFESIENKGSTFVFQFPLEIEKMPKGIVKGF